jgi:hypothetical protein
MTNADKDRRDSEKEGQNQGIASPSLAAHSGSQCALSAKGFDLPPGVKWRAGDIGPVVWRWQNLTP